MNSNTSQSQLSIDESAKVLAKLDLLGDRQLEKQDYTAARETYELALPIAEQVSDHKTAATVLGKMAFVSIQTGDLNRASEFLRRSIDFARISDAPSVLLASLRNLGIVLREVGDLSNADVFLLEGLQLAQQLGTVQAVADLSNSLGILAQERNDPQQAEIYLQRALHAAERLDDKELLASILSNIATLALDQGHFEKARHDYERAIASAPENMSVLRSGLLMNLSGVAINTGDRLLAKKYLEEALSLARNEKPTPELAKILGNIGGVYHSLGYFDEARIYLEEALSRALAVNDSSTMVTAHTNLGALEFDMGKYEQAQLHYQEGLRLANILNDTRKRALLLANLAELEATVGLLARAATTSIASLNIALKTNDPWLISVSHAVLGYVALKRDDLEAALIHYQESLAMAHAIGAREHEALAYFGLAQVEHKMGKHDTARVLATTSLTILDELHHVRRNEVQQWLAGMAEKPQSVSESK